MSPWTALFAVIALAAGCDKVFGLSGGGRADAGLDASDASDADAGPVAQCSPITMLGDSFAVDDIDTKWPSTLWPVAQTRDESLVFPGDHLEMHLSAFQSYLTLASPFYYDFRGQMLSFKFTDFGISEPGADGSFSVSIDSTYVDSNNVHRQLSISREGDRLVARSTNSAGTATAFVTLDPFDPHEHANVRIGIVGDQAVFETSSDGIMWMRKGTTQYDHMDFVHVQFQAFRNNNDVNIALYKVMGGTPSGEACKMAALRDTFDGDTLSRDLWAGTVIYDPVTLTVDEGTSHFTTGISTSAAPSTAYLIPSLPYDLVDGQFFMQVPLFLHDNADEYLSLSLKQFGGDEVTMQYSNGAMVVTTKHGVAFDMPYQQPLDKGAAGWWQIRNTNHVTYAEVSGDGVHWMTLASSSQVANMPSANVSVHVYSQSALGDEVRIDNVDAPPL